MPEWILPCLNKVLPTYLPTYLPLAFPLTLFRSGGRGGGVLRPYKTFKLNNFKTVKAMTTNFSDFSYNLSGNIQKLI